MIPSMGLSHLYLAWAVRWTDDLAWARLVCAIDHRSKLQWQGIDTLSDHISISYTQSYNGNFQLGLRIRSMQGRSVRYVIQDDVTSRSPARLV